MGFVLILLVIFGYVSADRMARRQTKDIETIVQKFITLRTVILVITHH